MKKTVTLNNLYDMLLARYGPQGWWPLYNVKKVKSIYVGRLPRSKDERFEMMAGAVLTQSVSWKNVETALHNLKSRDMLRAEDIIAAPHDELAAMIRPAGYFNQKALKLKALGEWFLARGVKTSPLKNLSLDEFRNELLAIRGVGPETADSILLYGYDVKSFVVDAYTKRLLSRMGIIDEGEKYESVRSLFHEKFHGGEGEYREYHALMVMHAKEHCSKRPRCEGCPVGKFCFYE